MIGHRNHARRPRRNPWPIRPSRSAPRRATTLRPGGRVRPSHPRSGADVDAVYRLSEGFGSGMGTTTETCGALSGAIMVLSQPRKRGHRGARHHQGSDVPARATSSSRVFARANTHDRLPRAQGHRHRAGRPPLMSRLHRGRRDAQLPHHRRRPHRYRAAPLGDGYKISRGAGAEQHRSAPAPANRPACRRQAVSRRIISA